MPKSRKLSKRIKQKSHIMRRRSRNIRSKIRSKSRRKIRSKRKFRKLRRSKVRRRSQDGMFSYLANFFAPSVAVETFKLKDFKNDKSIISHINSILNKIEPKNIWTEKQIQDIMQKIQDIYKDRDLDVKFFEEYISNNFLTYNYLKKLPEKETVNILRKVYTEYIQKGEKGKGEGEEFKKVTHDRLMGTDEQYIKVYDKLKKFPYRLITDKLIDNLMNEVIIEDIDTKILVSTDYEEVPSLRTLEVSRKTIMRSIADTTDEQKKTLLNKKLDSLNEEIKAYKSL